MQAHSLLGYAGVDSGDADTGLRHSRRAAAAAIGDGHLARQAREARMAGHWASAPLRLVRRVTVPVAVLAFMGVEFAIDWLPATGLLTRPTDDFVVLALGAFVAVGLLVPPRALRI